MDFVKESLDYAEDNRDWHHTHRVRKNAAKIMKKYLRQPELELKGNS